MFLPTRSLIQLRGDMDLIPESSKIEVMVVDHCSARFVEKIIKRIFCCTKVAVLKSIVLRKRRQLGMLAIIFLGFLQLWITSRHITRHPLLRWKASSVTVLFLF